MLIQTASIEERGAESAGAQPFVKWAGGKRRLLDVIVPMLPPTFRNYYEPFAGGAALFYAVAHHARRCYLSDTNLELVITYRVIKEQPELLIARLKKYAARHSEEQYYRVRRAKPKDDVEMAARLLYLNRTCFNGLYRVNKRDGAFNVPFGRYTKPNIVQENTIRACHLLLRKVTLRHEDFRKLGRRPQAGDFVYFDPPYHPTGDDSFTSYTREDFDEADQLGLRDYALELHERGVFVMVSNSKTRLTEMLYRRKEFKRRTVQAPRRINCQSANRGCVEELLITNY
jgi:DNA adenine methylase